MMKIHHDIFSVIMCHIHDTIIITILYKTILYNDAAEIFIGYV